MDDVCFPKDTTTEKTTSPQVFKLFYFDAHLPFYNILYVAYLARPESNIKLASYLYPFSIINITEYIVHKLNGSRKG